MTWLSRPLAAVWLVVMFCHDLVVSSVAVARAVLSPRDITAPRFVVAPIKARSDLGVSLVANYITLTPGTLTVDVSADRSALLIHDLLAGDSGAGTRRGISDEIEPRVLRVTGS
jgi:multicomponent Na+:H+ antiporter subunit E